MTKKDKKPKFCESCGEKLEWGTEEKFVKPQVYYDTKTGNDYIVLNWQCPNLWSWLGISKCHYGDLDEFEKRKYLKRVKT